MKSILVTLIFVTVNAASDFLYYDEIMQIVTQSPNQILDAFALPAYVGTLSSGNQVHFWAKNADKNTSYNRILSLNFEDSINMISIYNNSFGWVQTSQKQTLINLQNQKTIQKLNFPFKGTISIDSTGTSLIEIQQKKVFEYNYTFPNSLLVSGLYNQVHATAAHFYKGKQKIIITSSTSMKLYQKKILLWIAPEGGIDFDTNDECDYIVVNSGEGKITIWKKTSNAPINFIKLPPFTPKNLSISTIKYSSSIQAFSVVFQDGSVSQFVQSQNYLNSSTSSSTGCAVSFTTCLFNCGIIKNSSTRGLAERCSCNPTYFWSQSKCLKNCSMVNFSTGFNSDSCSCQDNYLWTGQICQLDCDRDQYATGFNGQGCDCQKYFIWKNQTCQIQCSSVNYSLGVALELGIGCVCRQNYIWGIQTGCRLNCQGIPNALVNGVKYTSCDCQAGYQWNLTNFACTQIKNNTNNNTNNTTYNDTNNDTNSDTNNQTINNTVDQDSTDSAVPIAVGVAVPAAVLVGIGLTITIIMFKRRQRQRNQQLQRQMMNNNRGYPYPPYPQYPAGMPVSYAAPIGYVRNPAGGPLPYQLKPNSAKKLKSYTNIDENICSICLMGNTDALTSCKHQFHADCIYNWLKKDKTCPNCRCRNFTIKMV